MTTSARPRIHGLDRQHELLHLDCSADLRSYHRNLGPGVQERLFQTTSDALRAQLDEHRDFLLHQQRQGQPRLAGTLPGGAAPMPSQPQPQPQPQPHTLPSGPRQPLQPPLRPPLQSNASHSSQPPPKNPDVVPGDISTYPPALREALQVRRPISRAHDGRTVYHVMCTSGDGYRPDDTEVIRTHTNLQAANDYAAMYFLEEVGVGDGDFEYEVRSNGGLCCEFDSGDGFVRVHVDNGTLHASNASTPSC